ncbi:MAG: protein-export chaperone SecB [Chitinophagaceae bacterium]
MEKKEQPAYKILEILLMSSTFNREVDVDFSRLEIEQDTNVDNNTGPSTADGKFVVVLEVLLKGKVANEIVLELTTRMAAVFEKVGNPEQLPEELFRKINAPAIIYPFIREHVYTVANKGGVGNLLLQPINFTNH